MRKKKVVERPSSDGRLEVREAADILLTENSDDLDFPSSSGETKKSSTTPVMTPAAKQATKNVEEDKSSDDSSSDEETPDVRTQDKIQATQAKIQAMMLAHFEEYKHQGFRDIQGRKY